MEENLNPPEDRDNNRDNNRDNWRKEDYSRNNQPVSYTESYRRMNEKKLREEALRAERQERQERQKEQDGFKTNHSFDSSRNNSTNNIQRDKASSIHFENARNPKNPNVERSFNRVERDFNSDKRPLNNIWTILAYLIPVIIILIILYFNFLPFGFSDTQVINVGTPKDTSGVFYLEESPALGARQMIDGDYFRTVDGVVY
ncbi:MAG: hypothetical protein WC402_05370, partial [Candidatus Pacearchaeota archaeon]